MFRRAIPLVLVLIGTAAAPAFAQRAASSCDTGDVVRYLGINGIDCNCTIGSPDAENWAFRTEPRVTSLIPQTRGGRLLRVGDVITHIDGKLITTREGAQAMAAVKPGQTVILAVRRGGENLRFAIVAEVSCRDAHAGGYVASTRPSKTPVPSNARIRGSGSATTKVSPTPAPTPHAAYAAQQRPARGSFGFGLMCSGNCEIRIEENTGALFFSDPPEVYSVERGSGADKAGVRRGDVITHVNGESITSKEGGRIFGTAKPGETLRFTIRRNGTSRVVALTAAKTTPAVAELTKSSESLERAQQALRELQRAQARQMEQIQEDIRRSRAAEESRLREMQREFYRQEQEHRRKLTELSNELARAESRMRSALSDSMRAACAVTSVTPRPGSSRTLRYTGIIGETEVEVRGPNPVTVTESGDEVTITAGSTQIKVKTPRKR
jgi:hypothetical protein